ncbi:MAG TPA: hypothetical protein VLH09_03690 [Bryobacteraceae bacterium]|nr:hypothetical protein [Bryobacteraceae bacterium]
MKPNLDVLKEEIPSQISAQGFVLFRGYCRNGQARPIAFWDTGRNPDFPSFLATARQAGVKVVVFHCLEFARGMVDEALENLQDADMSAEERRGCERRLREMLSYQGFTCLLEAAYDCDGRTYVYEIQAEWFGEYHQILDQIEGSFADDQEGDEDDSMGDYFSRN